MKTIEESHPSLKLKEVNISFDIESFDERWRTEEHITKSLIRSEDVQEHTIDKAVLKEKLPKIIDTYMNKLHAFRADEESIKQGWKKAVDELIYDIKNKDSFIMKELGLE
jgi:hypothetical protein